MRCYKRKTTEPRGQRKPHTSLDRKEQDATKSPRHSLLHLQRQHGNHYVQQMLALTRKSEGETKAAPDVERAIQRARGGGQPLDSRVRAGMESSFGADFSGVRVHADAESDSLNRSLNARAFTTDQDIFFRQGAYSPGSSSGREVLAHELTHVVRQGGNAYHVQCWSYGSGSSPHSDYSEVPKDERKRVNAAMSLVKRVVDNPKKYPRCHRFFKDNCPSGSATTLKDKFDKATIWFDKDDSVYGSGVTPDHIAYTSETWRWGRWSLAGVFIHEMMHRCGQDDEEINDRAIVSCRFPDIAKHKPDRQK